jgi:anti-anti-sigma factor
MDHSVQNGVLIIPLDGNITAKTADKLRQGIYEILEAHPDNKVVFDAGHLHYISSGGLRVLLDVQKRKDPEKGDGTECEPKHLSHFPDDGVYQDSGRSGENTWNFS